MHHQFNIQHFYVLPTQCVTVDPGSRPDQKCARQRDSQKYVWGINYNLGLPGKEFRLCTVHRYIVRVWTARLLVLNLWLCLSREGMRHAFSHCYNCIAALSPWEQYILCPFRHTSIRQLLSSKRLEAVKLAQAGFGDFLADTGVGRLKGKRDGNKEVYFVDTICNSAGHKQIDCEY